MQPGDLDTSRCTSIDYQQVLGMQQLEAMGSVESVLNWAVCVLIGLCSAAFVCVCVCACVSVCLSRGVTKGPRRFWSSGPLGVAD